MKKAIVIFIILLVGGAWTVNKYITRANKSSDELERFLGHSTNYGYDAEIFLTEHAKQHHDEAFEASYRMWKFTPVSELDLTSHYDEKNYYTVLAKILREEAKAAGQLDAHIALIDIGKHYGVSPTPKDPPKVPKPAEPKKINTDATEAAPLGKPKLDVESSLREDR